MTTNRVVKTPKAIFCGMLTPNTRMNTGRKIDLGTPNRKLTSGRNSPPSSGTSARTNPRQSPAGAAMRKAASTSQAVTPRLASTSGRPASATSACEDRARRGRQARRRSAPAGPAPPRGATSPRTPAATISRSCRRIACARYGFVGMIGMFMNTSAAGAMSLTPLAAASSSAFSHRGELRLPVAREAQERPLELHLRDLQRQLVVLRDGLDRVVGVVAHVLERAVERVQALLDERPAVGQVLLGRRPAADEVRRHRGREVDQHPHLALGHDLVAERRVDHRGGEVVVEQVRHEPARRRRRCARR